jgi:hypothetical protein
MSDFSRQPGTGQSKFTLFYLTALAELVKGFVFLIVAFILCYRHLEKNKMENSNIVEQYLKGLQERLSGDDRLALSYASGASTEQLARLKSRCKEIIFQCINFFHPDLLWVS